MNPLLSPRYDDVFKMLFGDARNGEILQAFLEAALPLSDDDYREIILLNLYLPNENVGDKAGILDIKAKTASGKMIDIEIQMANHAALHERIVYYLAKMVTEQISEGELYDKIKPAICILITDFEMVPENRGYHNRFRLHDPESRTDFCKAQNHLLQIHTLELPKLPKQEDGTKLWDWLEFLKAKDKEELNMLAEKNPDVKKAVVKLIELSADDKARMLHEARIKAERDQKAREKFVQDEAWKIGLEEGRKNERLAIARNALHKNMLLEDIMALTGLSREEIQTLLH
ncbi:MAG: Rpn family recombination-promoting nuclease/putative transposase [Zoogloeaceae bacterium]|jgi:predicted transposase/invertase (TIGR01784 family)|nr:Rpn family recombination-promoting nuclease/putative transposase [Zoogloeaceae bacterium]